MTDHGVRYRRCDEIYTYADLRAVVRAEVADLPPETWRDDTFNFDDYLTESVHTGTIEVIDPDEDERRTTKYLYSERVVTFDELRDEVETEAAGLPPEQWLGGEFNFDDWLCDSLLIGTIEQVEDE